MEVVRTRTIRPSSRLKSSVNYKVDTRKVSNDDTLLVNVLHEAIPSFKKQYKFKGESVQTKDSISFRVTDNGKNPEIKWSGAKPLEQTVKRKPPKKKKPIIFLRIAWMKKYRGVTKDDIPSGAGSHVEENQDGGEVYNFMPKEGKYYGFARIQSNRNLRIERLGANKDDEYIKGVTVVLFAKNPGTGGQYIVGWYKNATLYRSTQHMRKGARQEHIWYNVVTETKNGYLVPEDDRIFELPEGPGQTNAWYVMDYPTKTFLGHVYDYMAHPDRWILRKPKRKPRGKAFQQDAEKRKKVEIAAMDMVEEYFGRRDYLVKYVHTKNFGWDMEAEKGKQTLLLEVKGLSNGFNSVELTPNEYHNSKVNRKHYRLCVVERALNKKLRQLHIFYYDQGHWQDGRGKTIKVVEVKSARFELKS